MSHPWHAHMNLNQGYSHFPTFLTGLLLLWMARYAYLHQWKKHACRLMALLGFLICVSALLSVFMHRDLEDGKQDNVTLELAEYGMILGIFVLGALIFLGSWFVGRAPMTFSERLFAPFSIPMFRFLIVAWFLVLLSLPWSYMNGMKYYDKHSDERDKGEKAKEGWTDYDKHSDESGKGWTNNYEISTVYHLQWHVSIGMFGLLTAFSLFCILQERWEKTSFPQNV